MKFIVANIKTIGWVAIAVLLTVLWSGSCNGKKELKLQKQLYEVKMEVQEAKAELSSEKRLQDRRTIDSQNAIINRMDEKVKKEIRTIIKEYHEVPVFINSLNDDSLRAAAERWK